MGFTRTLSLAAVAALVAGPALAHHPLNGAPMETFAHGLLSGVGHPVLGFDHLFFIVAVGVAAVYTGRALLAPLAFIAAMLGGTVLSSAGVELAVTEQAIALSLLALGGVVMAGRALSLPVAAVLFAGLGVFHGLAYGGALAGIEGGAPTGVFAGYLIGLAVTQYLIAIAAGWAVARLWNAATADAVPARLTGALVAGVGLFLCLEVAEGLAFDALGIDVPAEEAAEDVAAAE